MIRIRSKKDGFRRCKIAHSTEWKAYQDDYFTPDEVKILTSEPMLQVEFAPDPVLPLAPHEPEPASAEQVPDPAPPDTPPDQAEKPATKKGK